MEIWQKVLLKLKVDLASAYISTRYFREELFDKYFRDSWLVAIEDGTAFLDSQRPQILREGLQKFHRRLSDTFRSVAGYDVKFQLTARKSSASPREVADTLPVEKLGLECA